MHWGKLGRGVDAIPEPGCLDTEPRRRAQQETEEPMERVGKNDLLPGGGHYSPGRRVGNLIFTAGQVPRDSRRAVIGVTIEEQTEATLKNVETVLHSFGASMRDVVKATVHLQDTSDVPQFNVAYAKFFPGSMPVRTVVGSELNGVLVEIDVVAFIEDGSDVR
jgi:2-iminobutanoate/2-iminopropanoate deaminase